MLLYCKGVTNNILNYFSYGNILLLRYRLLIVLVLALPIMIKSFSQVGINSADKTLAILAKSDVVVIIVDAAESTNQVVELAETKYLQKCIKITVSGNNIVTTPDMFNAMLERLTNNLTKKQELIISTIGTHEDGMHCSHATLVKLVGEILGKIFTALGQKNIAYLISGIENGPELISARIAVKHGIDVRIMAATKYRVRKHGVIYETTEDKLRDYIMS